MEIKSLQFIILASVFVLQFLAEHALPQSKEMNSWKHERYNLSIGVLNILLTLVPAGLFVQWIEFVQVRQLGLLHQFHFPFLPTLLLSIFFLDFWMYAWHRGNHQIAFLWQFHRFHHKETKMNSTTALRFHVIELYFSYPGKALVCLIFGISFLPLVIYEILFFAAVIIHHSNISISERADNLYRIVFASPRMHRIHHSDQVDETDSNFGGLFSFWDKLFGSDKRKPKAAIKFGLPLPTVGHNL